MKIKTEKHLNILIITLSGEVDHHIADEVRTKIDREFDLNKIKSIIFDFSEVSFMDSSGIGMIIGRYKNAQKYGGVVALASVSENADRIFDISGIYKIVRKYDSIDQALKEIS